MNPYEDVNFDDEELKAVVYQFWWTGEGYGRGSADAITTGEGNVNELREKEDRFKNLAKELAEGNLTIDEALERVPDEWGFSIHLDSPPFHRRENESCPVCSYKAKRCEDWGCGLTVVEE